jgi:hypothetical protein
MPTIQKYSILNDLREKIIEVIALVIRYLIADYYSYVPRGNQG